MPKRVVYKGEVEYLQIMDENGVVDEELAKDTLADADVIELYEVMFLDREFDEASFKLQRSGRMGTFPQNKGHEAVALGAAKALRKGVDYIVPYYRENAALFYHGLPMHYALLHWMGDERGNAIPKDVAMNAINLAIGTHALHAAGIAWAFKLRKEDRVVINFFGDGATSTGDVHEALNFASVLQLPCVFVCMNNQFAISVPCCTQTHARTFAQKALAYDMPTIQVDGNDIFAVFKATREALERARNGGGPSFIEAITYRLGDHTTADDVRRYRDAAAHEIAVTKDPLLRLRKYLDAKNLWDDAKQTALEERTKKTVHDVIEVAMTIDPPQPEDLFRYTFETLPDDLIKQMQTLRTDSIGQNPEQVGLNSPVKSEEPRHA